MIEGVDYPRPMSLTRYVVLREVAALMNRGCTWRAIRDGFGYTDAELRAILRELPATMPIAIGDGPLEVGGAVGAD
jgi:hypothetical protein